MYYLDRYLEGKVHFFNNFTTHTLKKPKKGVFIAFFTQNRIC